MARIYIGIGSNVDREAQIRCGIARLRTALGPLRLSQVYESASFGYDGPAFYNLVAEADTPLSIAELTALFKLIEREQGRPAQATKTTPRRLDLDLLCYDQSVCCLPVVLPRPDILQHAYVLCPMAELAPDYIHPETGTSLSVLWQQFQPGSDSLRVVALSPL